MKSSLLVLHNSLDGRLKGYTTENSDFSNSQSSLHTPSEMQFKKFSDDQPSQQNSVPSQSSIHISEPMQPSTHDVQQDQSTTHSSEPQQTTKS